MYAVGDVPRLPNAWRGPEPVRTEHWTAAVEHASLVAANIVGPDEAAVYDSVPFVWSDQYDARIQIAGHTSESLTMAPLLGDVDGDAFVAGFHDGDRLRGVVALNSMRAFVRFRRLLTEHPTSAQAADLAQSLAAGPP
ncbi:MAG TPA: hypothetical protein DEP69_00980 [Acidimicrobiaceae bacterium]|nr:hypothetical protein [Acidimicrobiaceae bacterium]